MQPMLGNSEDVFVCMRTRNKASRRNKFWLQRQEIQVNAHTHIHTHKAGRRQSLLKEGGSETDEDEDGKTALKAFLV